MQLYEKQWAGPKSKSLQQKPLPRLPHLGRGVARERLAVVHRSFPTVASKPARRILPFLPELLVAAVAAAVVLPS